MIKQKNNQVKKLAERLRQGAAKPFSPGRADHDQRKAWKNQGRTLRAEVATLQEQLNALPVSKSPAKKMTKDDHQVRIIEILERSEQATAEMSKAQLATSDRLVDVMEMLVKQSTAERA